MRPTSARCLPCLRRIAAYLGLCVVALAPGLTGHAQEPSTSIPVALRTWIEAVELYRDGAYGPAALRVATIAPEALLDQGGRAAEQWRAERSDGGERRLRAAAALSLELGLLHLGADKGRVSDRYLELGELSVKALERSRTNADTFGALWRLGQMQFMLLAGEGHEVERRSRRDDTRHLPPPLRAEWQVARGITFERAARLSPGAAAPQVFSRTPGARTMWAERNRQRALDEYRRALEADPAHLETRVRIGRVLMELGRADAARGHLEAAATAQCLETVCGLAWLFLGEWHMGHGKADDAQRAFIEASRVLEVRQSALLGLMNAALRERPALATDISRQFDARAMLGRLDTPDAWSRYLSGHPFGLMSVLAALRAGVTQ